MLQEGFLDVGCEPFSLGDDPVQVGDEIPDSFAPGRLGHRQPDSETVIHSDQGTPFTSWAFTDRARQSGLVPSIGVSRGLLRL